MQGSGSKGFGSVERGGSGRASAGKDHNGETNPDRPQVTFWDFSVERDEEAAANAAADGDADTIPPQVMFIHQVLPRIALLPPPPRGLRAVHCGLEPHPVPNLLLQAGGSSRDRILFSPPLRTAP